MINIESPGAGSTLFLSPPNNFASLQRILHHRHHRQFPFAMAKGLRDALYDARREVQAAMKNGGIEGGAHRWTLQGMRVEAPSKYNLKGRLVFLENRGYMKEIMYGGVKKARGRKIPEPNIGVAPLDARGNFRRGWLQRAANQKKTFVGRAGKRKIKGIWRRPTKSAKLQLLVALERPQRQQQVTFDGPGIGKKALLDNFGKRFEAALEFAIRTSR